MFSPNANAYPVTITSSTTGAGEWIKATINFPNGTSDTVTRVGLWSGVPSYISSISTSQWTAGGSGSKAINVSQSGTDFYGWPFNSADLVPPNGRIDTHGASDYTWSCSGLTYTQNPVTVGYRYTAGSFSGTGAAVITIHGWNACGFTSNYQAVNVSSGDYEYTLSPNPASRQVTVSVSANNILRNSGADQVVSAGSGSVASSGTGSVGSSGGPITYTVRVIDLLGNLYYNAKKSGNSFTIPVSNLKNGNYVVEISDGKTVSSKPLLIAH